MNLNSEEEYETEYFGIKILVFKIKGPYWACSPWRFKVGERSYIGIPNYCDTKRSALKRAWYRAKWLHDETYSDRYQTIQRYPT